MKKKLNCKFILQERWNSVVKRKYESKKCELLSLYHLVEFELVSLLDDDVPLEVDTTLIPLLCFDDIQWSLL